VPEVRYVLDNIPLEGDIVEVNAVNDSATGVSEPVDPAGEVTPVSAEY